MNNEWNPIVITLFCSAFFSTARVAFVSSNQLVFGLEKRQQNVIAKILNFFYQHSNQYLTFIVIGSITSLVIYTFLMIEAISGFVAIYVSGETLILLASMIITIGVYWLFGEFLPQILVLINPHFYLSIMAIPLYTAYIFFYPFSKFISAIGWILLMLFGVKFTMDKSLSVSRSDLDQFIQKTLNDAPENAELDKEVRLFHNAMEFSNVKIKDCIVPRTEIAAIEYNSPIHELTELFVKTGFSKLIVYKEDIDNIIGYIHSLELFSQPSDWTQSIYSLPFVPENMAANKLMENMLAEKKSIAVVVDEFGGTVGVITLEDLVEEIFGEIEDEHDIQSLQAKRIGKNEFIFSGRLEIDKLNQDFGLNIPESDDYLTMAGYILHHFQDFPKVNETIVIDNFAITILKVTHTKIELVKVKSISN